MKRTILFSILVAGFFASFVSDRQKSIPVLIKESIYSVDSSLGFGFIDNLIKNKTIIVLGEAGHGDGTSFIYKQKLIRYLHEKHGYTNLVMEGGSFFALHYYPLFASDSIKTNWLRGSIFPIWTYAVEFQKTLNYASTQKLRLIGIESQQSIMNNQYIPDSIQKIANINQHDPDFKHFTNLYYSLLSQEYKAFSKAEEVAFFTDYLKCVKQKLNQTKNNRETIQFYKQVIDCISLSTETINYSLNNLNDVARLNNLRDSMMFQNFMVQYKPGKKYIIWTANFHAAQNIKKIEYSDTLNIYKRQYLLGSWLKTKFKNQVYSIAFIAGHGERATIFDEVPAKIDTCFNCPIEQNLYPYNKDMYLSLHKLKISPFKDSIFTSQIFGAPHAGNWFQQYDGIFYINKMEKAHLVQ